MSCLNAAEFPSVVSLLPKVCLFVLSLYCYGNTRSISNAGSITYLKATNFTVFVRQHLAGMKFSDFYISFGASGIIISDFRSTFVMFYI